MPIKKNKLTACVLMLCLMLSLLTGCKTDTTTASNTTGTTTQVSETTSIVTETTPVETTTAPTETEGPPALAVDGPVRIDNISIPEYNGKAYVAINRNIPFFTEDEISKAKTCIEQNTKYFGDDDEHYSDLDSLGRCGVATALLSKNTMPPDGEERGSIGMVKPAGWHTSKYDKTVISDMYLYNRCHLIGWQLGNENANEKNLTTGTRYLNVEGMLPFENKIDDYIENTHQHVLYRVTPIYIDSELVCRGILMEAMSIEDDLCTFCVYCYDVQPGVKIDYLTGDNWLDTDKQTKPTETTSVSETKGNYVLNTHTMKIHRPDCDAANKISVDNRQEFSGSIDELLNEGYTRCKSCNPE